MWATRSHATDQASPPPLPVSIAATRALHCAAYLGRADGPLDDKRFELWPVLDHVANHAVNQAPTLLLFGPNHLQSREKQKASS